MASRCHGADLRIITPRFDRTFTFWAEVLMRMMTAVFVSLFLIAADDAKDAVKKEMAKLDGEWTLVSAETDGAAMPDQQVKTMKRVCKDGVTHVTMGGQTFIKAKFVVDPAKKPKTIDYT